MYALVWCKVIFWWVYKEWGKVISATQKFTSIFCLTPDRLGFFFLVPMPAHYSRFPSWSSTVKILFTAKKVFFLVKAPSSRDRDTPVFKQTSIWAEATLTLNNNNTECGKPLFLFIFPILSYILFGILLTSSLHDIALCKTSNAPLLIVFSLS